MISMFLEAYVTTPASHDGKGLQALLSVGRGSRLLDVPVCRPHGHPTWQRG